jgi:peptidoglycan/xylan/chitin deacetylase (PgdA/CDA1 family)
MILRDDDIFLTESPRGFGEYYNFDKFKEIHEIISKNGKKHYLAINAGEIENYPELIGYILNRKDEFEFGLHGWQHERYSEWNSEAIEASLARAKKKVEERFNVKVKWFFPPWNKRSEAMKLACERLGLRLNDNWITPQEALEGKTADSICFHYWNNEEKKCIQQMLENTALKEKIY